VFRTKPSGFKAGDRVMVRDQSLLCGEIGVVASETVWRGLVYVCVDAGGVAGKHYVRPERLVKTTGQEIVDGVRAARRVQEGR
jgi:hypothetical protein